MLALALPAFAHTGPSPNQAFADRKVFVHCQMNFRASSMVFQYRVITLKDPPEKAWESVQRAWVPYEPL